MMGQLFFFLERIVDDNVDHSLIGIVCSSWRMLHTMIRLWWMDDGVMAVVPRDPICVICPTSGSWFDWANRIRNLDSVSLHLYRFCHTTARRSVGNTNDQNNKRRQREEVQQLTKKQSLLSN